jgi:hypothetical protein
MDLKVVRGALNGQGALFISNYRGLAAGEWKVRKRIALAFFTQRSEKRKQFQG